VRQPAGHGGRCHLALQEILGEAALQALAEQGRYRRDVY
jgi:sulfite reductase (NADPH) flavoprotein alpha-component